MKDFQFRLDTVLRVKGQVLNNLRNEYSEVTRAVAKKKQDIEEPDKQFDRMNFSFREKKEKGITALEASLYGEYMKNIHSQKNTELNNLEVLKMEEERKREAVVEAKIDKSTIDKLREKKYSEYKNALRKEEERIIDELIVQKRFLG